MGFFGSSFLFANMVGLVLFGLGLAARLGYLKRMFIGERATGAYSRNTAYTLMPAGLFLLSFYPISLWTGDGPMGDPLALAILAVLFALPLVTLVWQPTWLKPAWLQWLEANYGPMLEKMFKAARQMGISQWADQVKTQTGLEQWANEVVQKKKWKRAN